MRGFIVISGTGIKDFRKWAPGATEALSLMLELMKLRRPAVRVEDERGNLVSFFQLKEIATQQARRKTPGD